MSQAAIESALAALIHGPPIDPDDGSALAALLERHGVEPTDREFLLAGDRQRLLVYRQLVRRTLRSAVEAACPRSVARLGGTFDAHFAAFLAARGSHSHYLRDVTGEFLDWVEPHWSEDPRVPRYLHELARHEALQIELGAMPMEEVTLPAAELAPERSLAFTEACRLVRYDHALHELPDELDDRAAPERRPTALFAYRNRQHEVRFLELTPLAASILEQLLAGTCLREALSRGAAHQGASLDPAVVDGTARLLADLADRGALLGVR